MFPPSVTISPISLSISSPVVIFLPEGVLKLCMQYHESCESTWYGVPSIPRVQGWLEPLWGQGLGAVLQGCVEQQTEEKNWNLRVDTAAIYGLCTALSLCKLGGWGCWDISYAIHVPFVLWNINICSPKSNNNKIDFDKNWGLRLISTTRSQGRLSGSNG